MRIRLLTNLGEEKINYLNAPVLLKTPRKTIRSLFILDTGSPNTILSYTDARRLQIPFASKSKQEIINLGGRKFQAYSFHRSTVVFVTDKGESVKEDFEEIKLIRPTSTKEIQELDKIPTIIGTDFLKGKKYKLFCDFANDEAYMER